MPDTGAPHFIPFADPTNLVRDWPALSEDVAEAVADGLDAAGGLVAVKSAIFTGVQASTIDAGSAVDITDLVLSHAVSDAANKVVLIAIVGQVAASNIVRGVGGQITAGGTPVLLGDADGSRVRVQSMFGEATGTGGRIAGNLIYGAVHTPGTTASVEYKAQAISVGSGTIFINRSNSDSNSTSFARSASTLILMEVKV